MAEWVQTSKIAYHSNLFSLAVQESVVWRSTNSIITQLTDALDDFGLANLLDFFVAE